MDFIEQFVADFTPEELTRLFKKQLLRIAIVGQNEETIRNILSESDPAIVIRRSDLIYVIDGNLSDDIKVMMIMYKYHESEPYLHKSTLVELITSTQNTDFYDRYSEKLNDQLCSDRLFIQNISKPKMFCHLMNRNRIPSYDTLFSIGLSIKDSTILSRCGLLSSPHHELYDDQDKPLVSMNNLFMRCCADGRLGDVKNIMKKMKYKSRQLN